MKVVVVIAHFLLLRFVNAVPTVNCANGESGGSKGVCKNVDRNASKGFCPNGDNTHYDDVQIVITDRARKPEPDDRFIINALYSLPKERDRAMRFDLGSGLSGGKDKSYDVTVKTEDEVIKVTIDRAISKAQILYDVKYCKTGVFYGLRGTDADDKEGTNDDNRITADMKKYLTENELMGGGKNLLLYTHGIANDALDTIQSCDEFNTKKDRTNYYAVPIIWSSSTNSGLGPLNLCLDKEKNAPAAADMFANDLWPLLENSGLQISFMSHSLGNYVLSMFAQYMAESPKTRNIKPFEEIFMVAPCLRNNIFDEEENKGADIILNESPDELFGPNQKYGGLNIANLAKNKVHVLWTDRDFILWFYGYPYVVVTIIVFLSVLVLYNIFDITTVKETLQLRRSWKQVIQSINRKIAFATVIIIPLFIGVNYYYSVRLGLSMTNIRGCSDYAALGATGGKAKEKLASILNDKVMFHKIDHPGIPGHSYQFGSEAVDIYEKYNI